MIVFCIIMYVIIALATAIAMPRTTGLDSTTEFWTDLVLGAIWPVIIVAFILARLFNWGRK